MEPDQTLDLDTIHLTLSLALAKGGGGNSSPEEEVPHKETRYFWKDFL